MILNHFDNFSYFYTIMLLFLALLVINFANKGAWIQLQRNKIAYLLASMQFVLFVYTTFDRLFNDRWYETLMQDLCHALSYFSIIVFYLNKNRVYKAVMPWLIIGPLCTMSASVAPIFSDPTWLMSYLEHTLMLVQGLFAYFWVNKYSKKELYSLLALPAILFVWILLSSLIPWQVTGDKLWADASTALLPPSLEAPQTYHILSTFGIPYPIPSLIFYALAIGAAMLIALNKQYYPFYIQKISSWFKIKWAKITLKKTEKQKQ